MCETFSLVIGGCDQYDMKAVCVHGDNAYAQPEKPSCTVR